MNTDRLKAWASANLTHLKWGSAATIALIAVLLVAQHLAPWLALAVAGPVFGWAVERYQAVRREGVPSIMDMVATAAPFEVAALIWWVIA